MPNRPQPHFPEPDTKHYWDGVKEGELRYQTCNSCNTVNFYPTAHCQNCGSGSQTWKVSKGEGTVYPFSVVMQNRIPGFQDLGAYAVAMRHRTSQALMYFWSFALCLWAFLTPSLYVGPAHLWFWLFWLYHLFIPVSTAWILVADRFRPTWRDWRHSVLVTLAFMAALAVLDAITGWNYGFVGPSKPTQANLLDFLGPYPLRLVWMACVGTGLFALLMLPWMRRRERPGAALP